MANLNAERDAAEAEQQRKLQEHLAALEAEKQQSKQLEQQLQRHQVLHLHMVSSELVHAATTAQCTRCLKCRFLHLTSATWSSCEG